ILRNPTSPLPPLSYLSASPTPRTPRPPLLPYTTLFRSATGPQQTAPREPPACGTSRTHARTCPTRVPAPPDRRPRRRVLSCHHRSEEHTSELQSRENLVCRLLLEKKKE